MATNKPQCGTVFSDTGVPLFFITNDETLVDESSMIVFDYHQVQQLLGYITEYLILADDYYEEDYES